VIENIDQRETVPPPHLEVGKIVSRRDFDGAGAGLRVSMLVGNDRHETVGQWEAH